MCTRSDFARTFPQVNSGSLCDLLRGKINHTKGFRFIGIVETEATD